MDRQRALNLVAACLAAGILLAAPGCRSQVPIAADTSVRDGDRLHGRMASGREQQTFSFEGAESSLLDFTVRADDGSEAAPLVSVVDPEGLPVDVAAATTTTPGSATVRVKGVPLTKSGTYKVVATPAFPGRQVYYSFQHELRFAPPPDRDAHLSAVRPTPVHVSAPRGGLVAIRITPKAGSNLVPDVLAVRDPWGGPALDPEQVPPGANPPRVSRTFDGAMVLTFTAPRPGMYTIMAGSKPGHPGVGTLNVEVRTPRRSGRAVIHDDRSARDFGLPGEPPRPSAAPPLAQR